MEAVILIGLQASGKSTFCKQRFVDSHVRINLDMLRTRRKEQILLDACFKAKLKIVVDNTNPTEEDRLRYIPAAQAAGYRVIGYYFSSQIEQCKERNEHRDKECVVPLPGLLSTYGRLQLPAQDEGFDELYYVEIKEDGTFAVSGWTDEV